MTGPTSATPRPLRDGTRDGTPASTEVAGCMVCSCPLPAARAQYCSRACQQRAYRLRHHAASRLDTAALRRALQQQRLLVAHTIYECGECGERRLGERRCPDCNRFSAALGLGGACPDCQEPILLAELLELEVTTH